MVTRSNGRPTVCFVSLSAYAYFDPSAGVPTGGAERQLSLVGRELADEFDVRFVVGDYGQPATEVRDGITLHRAYAPGADVPLSRRPGQVLDLYRAMRRADADVYVFRGEYARAVLTYAIATLLGARWVYNLALDSQAESADGRGPDPARRVVEWVVRDADGVVAQTPHQRAALRRSFGVDPAVVPNGYPPLENVLPYADREFFLYVGRIDEAQKRPHLFLELARRLPEESFVLAGPGSGDEYHDRIAREASALENLAYLGRVDPDEIHDYYRRAVALVNTSAQEGFPNTFLEAWRAGTPVLGLDVDPGRFLDDPSAGYADGDLDRLADLARRLADSEAAWQSLAERGRRQFERNYQISAVADAYADVLWQALDGDADRARVERRTT